MSKQTFDFSEALKRMKQGKKVNRKAAKAAKAIEYITLIESHFYTKRYMLDNLVLMMFSSSDILATDWEEVEE